MEQFKNEFLVAEHIGIGLKNEKSLHAAIKNWYGQKGDRLEVKVGSYVVDLVRDDLLIEIQTKNFSAIGKKLRKLSEKHKVLLVHPIAKEKWILKVDPEEGKQLSRRKSPKKGQVFHVFNELVRIHDLINKENFTLEILLVKEEEIQCPDGMGSWRRKGVSIIDRKLLEVTESIKLSTKKDFVALLPQTLPKPFSNKDLSIELKVPINLARKITYCLKKMDAIEEVGKKRNELLFNY